MRQPLLWYARVEAAVGIIGFTFHGVFGVVTAALSLLGIYLGNRLRSVWGKRMEQVGGLILILIGASLSGAGAARLGLKIVDLPIRYRERTYGSTNINRWRHGWLLLKMVLFAARRIKFI